MQTIETIRNGLADAIMQAAKQLHTPDFIVRDDLGNMTDAEMIGYYRATGKIIVWSGGSERTIYGNPRVNWQFRAWHDYCHILSGVCNRDHGRLGCFEPIAEYVVANWQCDGIGDMLAKIVQLEVSGQARYFADHGTFIADQITFTLANL